MKLNKNLNGLWIGKTGESNAWYHIFPFCDSSLNNKLYVVRHKRPQRDIKSNKIKFITFSFNSSLSHMLFIFINGLRVLMKNKIDYIVCFSLVPWGIIGWFLSKLFQKKIIVGLIGSDYNYYVEKSRFRIIFEYILKNSDVITTTGSVMNKSVQKRIKNSNVHIFPHCLPRDLIYERKYKKNKNLQLISISELTENKRTIDVIKAVEILRDRGIIVSLKILGDGQKFNSLKNYISKKLLDNQIQLVGYTKNIKHYLLNSDIFVQASLNEGLSLSLIESIGMGLVPVVTEAGSEKDILSNNTNGLFIKKKNPNDLADKLQFLSSENNFEHFFNAVKELKINLDIKNATKKVDQILSNL